MAEGPIPVSVCILCLDEAERLPACLGALGAFSEVIVLDTGSRDGSPEVAEGLGARVIRAGWEGFTRTRRRLFGAAGQEWIFWLDADEIVPPGLVREMGAALAVDPGENGFEVNRMVVFQGRPVRHGDWFPDWNLRVFRRGSWSMEDRAVHERVDVTGTVGRFRSVMAHHSFRDWDDRRARARRYAALWARQALSRGRRAAPWDPWGHALASLLRGYLFRRGFLDGRLGWQVAVSNAAEVRLKYRLLLEGQQAPGEGDR